MKLAVISLKGRSSTKVAEEAGKYFDKADLIDIRNVEVQTTTKGTNVFYEGEPLEDYDAVYVRGSYKYYLLQRSITTALLGKTYLAIEPAAFTIGHNKFLTMLCLQRAKVPLPTTYLAGTTKAAKRLLEKVNYPIIIKIPEGTQGRGVMFADSAPSAKSVLDTLEVFNQPYILQEYIETGERTASDIRAIVVGEKVVAAMKRTATTQELRANIHMGAKGEPYKLSYEAEKVALKTASAVGTDVCAVDILRSDKDYVLEINLSPGLMGVTEATGINVPEIIAKYLHGKAKEFKEKIRKESYKEIMEQLAIKDGVKKEIITNLDIKAGIIKLPDIVAKMTGFKDDEEVSMVINRNKVEIKRTGIR